MGLTGTLLEVIDFRSFSSLWYWLALALFWTSASHWVLGVPYDMIQRARRDGAVAGDMEALAHINARRVTLIARMSGAWILGLVCFALSSLLVLAVAFGVEFAQALLFLAVPMVPVGWLSVRVAGAVLVGPLQGEPLVRVLLRHRVYVQFIGIAAIFLTALYGMYHNLAVGGL